MIPPWDLCGVRAPVRYRIEGAGTGRGEREREGRVLRRLGRSEVFNMYCARACICGRRGVGTAGCRDFGDVVWDVGCAHGHRNIEAEEHRGRGP